MDKRELESELLHFLADQLQRPVTDLKPSDELKRLGLDSFRVIELVLFLERKSGLTFPDHEYTPSNLKSVETLVACALRNSR